MSHMLNASTDAERTRRRRDKLRAAGLRPVQLWLPDTSAPGFAEEYGRRFARLAEADRHDPDGSLAWLDAHTDALLASLDREG